jgi:hypothetical protein
MFANVRSDGERRKFKKLSAPHAHAREESRFVNFANFVQTWRFIRKREAQTAPCRTAFCSDPEWQLSTHCGH